MIPPFFRPLVLGLLLGLPPAASAEVRLLTWWNFDDTAVSSPLIDPRGGVAAHLRNGATLTEPGGGRTGDIADRAIYFGTGPQNIYTPKNLYIRDTSFFNRAAEGDAVSVSFWQKLDYIFGWPISVFAVSPTSTGGGRGFSAQIPFYDGLVYFDTAGCCDPTQRISDIPLDGDGVPVSWPDVWHHVVLIKNGDLKEVYIDGRPGPVGHGAAPLPTDFTEIYIGNGPELKNPVYGAIDDFVVYSGALDAFQIAELSRGAAPDSIVGPDDTDADGLFDTYEYRFFPGDLTKLSRTGDFDSDSITDIQEFAGGTHPSNNDTDGDGLRDGAENGTGTFVSLTHTGTSPLVPDTDGDGLRDGVENPLLPFLNASQPGTNPNLTDTDRDSFGDGDEVLFSSNPRIAGSRPLRAGLVDILAYWSFNNSADPLAAVDSIKGFTGVLENGAVYTPDAGGRTGAAGDRAVDFGLVPYSSAAVRVAPTDFLNLAASQDEIAVSFWQRLNAMNPGLSFSGYSPGVFGGRALAGMTAKNDSPWNTNTPDPTVFYWYAGTWADSITGSSTITLADPPVWHHFVFQKKGFMKQVWLDGTLVGSGGGADPIPKDFTALNIGCDVESYNITGAIDDFVIYADALTQEQIAALAGGASPTSIVPPNTDADADGMDEAYEVAHGLNPAVDDSRGDLDGDGLANYDEYVKTTQPNNPDTDGDTVRDGAETATGTYVDLNNRGTNPLLTDTDGDGLSDGVENPSLPFVDNNQPGTDPNKSDSDRDFVDDLIEIQLGFDPTVASSFPLDPSKLDLLAYWSFDDATDPARAVDAHRGFEAAISGEVLYTDAGGGRTGLGSDRALDYGFAQGAQAVTVLGAEWLNLASAQNQIAVSFWQNLNQVISSTVVKMTSPSSTGVQRGLSAQATWGDNNFYFDTAGCCDGGTQRISVANDVDFVGSWHHIVFQKNGDQKDIWVDGVLKLSGTNTGPLPSDFTDLYIGTAINSESMLGFLDDFAIFADALTPEQIGRLAAGESPLALIGTAPAPSLQFTSISYNAATSQITLTWNSQPGKTYRLESSQNLATWPVELNDNIASDGATTTYVHTITSFPGGAPAALYYRVKLN